eukprot:jgi/Botrbrau1/1763/Bobra.0217s0018.1
MMIIANQFRKQHYLLKSGKGHTIPATSHGHQQNHWTTGDAAVNPLYSVLLRRSSTSISGSPLISNSSSWSLKIETSSCTSNTMSINSDPGPSISFNVSQKPCKKAWIWLLMAVVMRWRASRSTYSRLFSSVTLMLCPADFNSTISLLPKYSTSVVKVRSNTSVMSFSSIHRRFL